MPKVGLEKRVYNWINDVANWERSYITTPSKSPKLVYLIFFILKKNLLKKIEKSRRVSGEKSKGYSSEVGLVVFARLSKT